MNTPESQYNWQCASPEEEEEEEEEVKVRTLLIQLTLTYRQPSMSGSWQINLTFYLFKEWEKDVASKRELDDRKEPIIDKNSCGSA